MNKNINQKGATTLIYMSLLAIMAVLVLSLSYSRMLLALKRGNSFSDTLVASYKAESEVNDTLARLISGYIDSDDFPFNRTFNTDNGTKVEVIGKIEGDKQILLVTASRPFAVSTIRAVRTIATSSSSGIDGVEVALALDVTSSMDSAAVKGDSDGRPTKFEELYRATNSFIEAIEDHPEAAKFKIGLSVFKIDAKWVKTAGGVEITPANNIPISTIKQELQRQFTDPTGQGKSTNSLIAKTVFGNTSIGSGLSLLNTYYRNNTPSASKTKRVEIVVSDGLPNSRIPYAPCNPSAFCPLDTRYCSSNSYGWSCLYSPNDPAKCEKHALDFVSCTAAPNSESWTGLLTNGTGDRDPNIDLYTVLVYSGLREDQEIVRIFKKYSTQSYTTENATDLGRIFDDIFDEISTSVSSIVITRELPTE